MILDNLFLAYLEFFYTWLPYLLLLDDNKSNTLPDLNVAQTLSDALHKQRSQFGIINLH